MKPEAKAKEESRKPEARAEKETARRRTTKVFVAECQGRRVLYIDKRRAPLDQRFLRRLNVKGVLKLSVVGEFENVVTIY